MVNIAHGATITFYVGAHECQISHYARYLIGAYDICPAIRYLFADDVTYCLIPHHISGLDNGVSRHPIVT